MGAELRSEFFQAVSDAMKTNAKESHRIYGTARDHVPNAAQRELQRERSLDSGELVSVSPLTLLPSNREF